MNNEAKDPRMKGARMQSHAINIELELSSIFDCERFAMGGFINADHIRRTGFISAIVLILSRLYTSDRNRELIDEYLNEVMWYLGMGLDDIEEGKTEKILDDFEKVKNKLN